MAEIYPVIFGLVFICLLSVVTGLLLWLLNRPWWSNRLIRRTVMFIPVFGCVCILLWASGVKSDTGILTAAGATGAALTVVVEIALLVSLPLSGIIHILNALISRCIRWHSKSFTVKHETDKKRRLILKTAAAVLPVAAISTGAGGVAGSFSAVKIPEIPLFFSDLPISLEGLKILQISDTHLGYYVTLDDLINFLESAEQHKADIVLLTGDIADKVEILPDALKLIQQLRPQYGCYACLGNHEYYRGITTVKKAFSSSPIPLMISAGITVDIAGTPLYIAGADDPKWMRYDISEFMQVTVSKCFEPAPPDSFKVLISHRPNGFDYAAKLNVPLTLSGHTHGGQIGIGGKSLFEYLTGYKYLWGHYKKDNGCQLYTSAGIGHWFPYRLGCPPEAPLIVLKRG